jgi:hypothetical protein
LVNPHNPLPFRLCGLLLTVMIGICD